VKYPYQNKYLRQKAKSPRRGLSPSHVIALVVGAVIIIGLVIIYTREKTPTTGARANARTQTAYRGPSAQNQVASPAPSDVTPTTPRPDPPLQPETDPGRLPLRDVQVPFAFKLVDRYAKVDRGYVEVDFTVDVSRLFTSDDALKVAQKVVFDEIRQHKISAASIIVRAAPGMPKAVVMIDWAPFGNLARAQGCKPGDYRNHRFEVNFAGGIHTPGKR
jgi:hypothetical protein